jgi:hypothetical protein
MLTFIESPLFSDHVHDYLDDDEYAEFQFHVVANPEVGKLCEALAAYARSVGPGQALARAAVYA